MHTMKPQKRVSLHAFIVSLAEVVLISTALAYIILRNSPVDSMTVKTHTMSHELLIFLLH